MAGFTGIAQRAVPMLSYEDPVTAIGWLDRAFGFQEQGKRSVDDAGHVTHAELALDGARVMLAWTGHRWMFLQAARPRRRGAREARWRRRPSRSARRCNRAPRAT